MSDDTDQGNIRLLRKAIVKEVKKHRDGGIDLNSLRKIAISSLPNEELPNTKTIFKLAFEALEHAGSLIEEEGVIKLVPRTKDAPTKKRKLADINDNDTLEIKVGTTTGNNSSSSTDHIRKELWKYGEQAWKENLLDQDYLTKNPDRITRLFCGNLNKKITEEQLKNAISGIVYIKWIIDKTSKEFYGSSFLEMKDPESAANAVQMDKSKVMGRPLKVYYCPPKPGDVWPPVNSGSGGSTSNSAFIQRRQSTPKPEDCKKIFCGNLSYEIDDDTMVKFFEGCGEIVGLRWLTNKDTGEFRVEC